MHWVTQYLGKKWMPGARGPDQFDCWGLICDFYDRFLGVSLPLHQVLPSDLRKVSQTAEKEVSGNLWKLESSPSAFDVVGLGKKSIIHHVGLFIESDGGMVLHIGNGMTARVERINEMKNQYRRIEFYRHACNS